MFTRGQSDIEETIISDDDEDRPLCMPGDIGWPGRTPTKDY